MKDKIIIFVIGVLVGAVIATGSFYVYSTNANSCNSNPGNMQMNGNQPPEIPSGQNGQPSEMPSNSTQSNSN